MNWLQKRRAAADAARRREAEAAARVREADQRLTEAREVAVETRVVDDAKRRELNKNGWTELFAQALARRA